MLNTIKYTIAELVRQPGIMIWSLVFPLILMSVFSLMFGPLDELASFDPIRIAVVEEGSPDATDNSDGSNDSSEQEGSTSRVSLPEDEAFYSFIDAVSTGDDCLFDETFVSSAKEAQQLVIDSSSTESPVIGYVQVVNSIPHVYISDALSLHNTQITEAFILSLAMDEYSAKVHLLKDLITNNPQALFNHTVTDSLYSSLDVTKQVDVTRNQPKESVRYYFALLGMAALFGGSVSLVAFQRMRPNLSALGARRAVGGISYGKAVLATIIGCWIINFVCLTIAYAVMRFIIGIDFNDRDIPCLCVTATASLTALSLGCAVSAIPKIPENGKSGMLTGIVCFSALFAGLYGEPTMALADMIAENAPLVSWINPASQISQAFYSIMYYDSYTPLLAHLAALFVMALILFALSVHSLRRQRYASI